VRKHSSEFACTFLLAVALLTAFPSARAQNPPPGAPKIAAQSFKNIQVMKDVSCGDIIPAMQFISAHSESNVPIATSNAPSRKTIRKKRNLPAT